jgi:hypothetical protein
VLDAIHQEVTIDRCRPAQQLRKLPICMSAAARLPQRRNSGLL